VSPKKKKKKRTSNKCVGRSYRDGILGKKKKKKPCGPAGRNKRKGRDDRRKYRPETWRVQREDVRNTRMLERKETKRLPVHEGKQTASKEQRKITEGATKKGEARFPNENLQRKNQKKKEGEA